MFQGKILFGPVCVTVIVDAVQYSKCGLDTKMCSQPSTTFLQPSSVLRHFYYTHSCYQLHVCTEEVKGSKIRRVHHLRNMTAHGLDQSAGLTNQLSHLLSSSYMVKTIMC